MNGRRGSLVKVSSQSDYPRQRDTTWVSSIFSARVIMDIPCRALARCRRPSSLFSETFRQGVCCELAGNKRGSTGSECQYVSDIRRGRIDIALSPSLSLSRDLLALRKFHVLRQLCCASRGQIALPLRKTLLRISVTW